MQRHSGLFGWALNSMVSVFIRCTKKADRGGGGYVKTEAEIGLCGHKPNSAWSHQKRAERHAINSPQELSGSYRHANTLI